MKIYNPAKIHMTPEYACQILAEGKMMDDFGRKYTMEELLEAVWRHGYASGVNATRAQPY